MYFIFRRRLTEDNSDSNTTADKDDRSVDFRNNFKQNMVQYNGYRIYYARGKIVVNLIY